MIRQLLSLIVILFCISCLDSPKKESDENAYQIPKEAYEDIDLPDTLRVVSEDTLTELEKNKLFSLVLPGRHSILDFKKLELLQVPDLYNRISVVLKSYRDSSIQERLYISKIYANLEIRFTELSEKTEIPVEIKLKIAEIQSSIHSEIAMIKQAQLNLLQE